ncbi:MAG: ethanolamine ammonia-lyase subunit EutB, partial [Deltaproteobacteria bacterium]|nr:ethanolamine ammonia-lyase subunit EutB [Deltaproteobacteria bacterium]
MVGLLGILISLPTLALHKKLIGQANEFKEGDAAIGIAAPNQKERLKARKRLVATKIKELHEHPLYEDAQQKLIWQSTDKLAYALIQDWTLGELKTFLLNQPESEIKQIMPGLNSDVIACVVKLMSNQELIQVGQKIYNPLPDSKIGSKGYLGAR